MRTLKLVFAYDGTAYHGFQRQANAITVQQIIEEKLAFLFGEKIKVMGSGRTDTGVHAKGQVVSLKTNGTIPVNNLVRAANSVLPKDIVLKEAEEMPEDFHARYSAFWKRYCYRILVNDYDDPFERNFTWQMRQMPNLKLMQEETQYLLGQHDFSFFCSNGSVKSSPIKIIYHAEWQQQNHNELLFSIEGNGFLYHMVRNIVWNLVQVGLGHKVPLAIKKALESGVRTFKEVPAPGQGLYLDYVSYKQHSLAKKYQKYTL